MNNTEFWMESEAELRRIMKRLLREQKERIIEAVEIPTGVDIGNPFWTNEGRIFARTLEPYFVEKFLEAARYSLLETLGLKKQLEIGWELLELINEKALDWAKLFVAELNSRLAKTTRRIVEGALIEYIRTPGFTLQDFIDLITPSGFSEWRAENIAITETTRAFVQAGTEMAREMREAGIDFYEIWNTRNDPVVCEICFPLHGKPRGEDWEDPPPAHPHCRCWVTRSMFVD